MADDITVNKICEAVVPRRPPGPVDTKAFAIVANELLVYRLEEAGWKVTQDLDR